jgi:transcriptional regulator with XRE-family HTH domain
MPYLKQRGRNSTDGSWRGLPERLERARSARGLSQADLSRRSGVAKSLLSRIESQERPSLAAETLLRLSAALGVRPEWLWHGTGVMDAGGELTEHEKLAQAIEQSGRAFHRTVVAVANAFATEGERHMIDGWLDRLREIEKRLEPLLPENYARTVARGPR